MNSWVSTLARGLAALLVAIVIAAGIPSRTPAQPATGQPIAGGQTPSAPAAPAATTANRWTLFVWMAADNDLEPAGIEDLKEIELGLPETGVEVIVFVDRAKQNNKRFGDWSGGRLYRMRPHRDPKTLGSELLQDFGPVDSSDARLLSQHMADAFKRYPAQNYGVVLWNHGGGWSVLATDYDNPKAPGRKTGFQLPQVTGAVAEGLRLAGVPRLAMIGFDMCLMGQLETVAEFRDLASVLVASQAIEPGSGWSYDKFLPTLANPAATAHDLARSIVDTFHAYNIAAGEGTSTLAAIDLDKAAPLLASFDGALQALEPELPALWAPLSRSLFWAEQYAKNGRIDDLQNEAHALASVDIVDAMKRVQAAAGDGFKARAEVERFLAAAKDATIANLTSPRYRASNGIALYAPIRPTMVNGDYAGTRLAKETRWLPFLKALHGQIAQGSRAPEISQLDIVDATNGAPVMRGAFGDNTIIRMTMKGENVLFATSRVGEVDPVNKRTILMALGFLADTETMLERAQKATDAAELLAPIYDANGAKLSIDAPGIGLVVGSRDRFAQATISMLALGDAGIPYPAARALIELPNIGTVEAIVEFENSTLEAVNIIALIPGPEGRPTPRSVRPADDTQVTFLATVFYDDGRRERVPAGPAMRWGDGIRLVFDLPRPAKYRVWASAESIAGSGAEVMKEFEMAYPEPRMLAALHATRTRDPQSFAGRWALEDGTPFFEIKPIQGRTTLFEVESLMPQFRDKLKEQGLTAIGRIDLRRIPTLSIIYLDAQRSPKAGEHQILLVDPIDPNRLVLRVFFGVKGDARGQAIALRREGSAPVQPPMPQQAGAGGQPQLPAPVAPAPMPAAPQLPQPQMPQMPQPQVGQAPMPFPPQAPGYPPAQMPGLPQGQGPGFPQQPAFPQAQAPGYPTPPGYPQQPGFQPGGPGTIPNNAYAPPPPAVTMNYIDPRALIGGWRGQYRNGAMLTVLFHPNGTYQQQVQFSTQLTVDVVGRWALDGKTLTMLVQSWSPTQFCLSANQCQPIELPQRVDTPIEMQSNGYVVVTPEVVMQRFQ
ncbi:MAG: hypothetical protein JNK67_02080 [Alphaproteobacteria bacterium]|nr:hypothetical protein [Alphaproteobacteria bacterium]